MKSYNKVFGTKAEWDKTTNKIVVKITMKPAYARLVKIAKRTKNWRSQKRLLTRIMVAMTGKRPEFKKH